MIHTAPLVGNRGEYVNYSIKKRKSILLALVYFASSIDVKMNSIIIEKSYISNQKQFLDRLENLLKEFLNENSKYLSLFDEIIVYYDKGQDILMKIIRNSFKDYKNVKIKTKFNHEDRLFQIADLLTFIDKIDYKINNKLKLIKSEKLFFNEFNAKEILKRINKNR